jgi:hypothetical protein
MRMWAETLYYDIVRPIGQRKSLEFLQTESGPSAQRPVISSQQFQEDCSWCRLSARRAGSDRQSHRVAVSVHRPCLTRWDDLKHHVHFQGLDMLQNRERPRDQGQRLDRAAQSRIGGAPNQTLGKPRFEPLSSQY